MRMAYDMIMEEPASAEVTLTTKIIDHNGNMITSTTLITTEKARSPAFTTRAAHRAAEEAADCTRTMLGVHFGESEEGWKK